MPRPILGTNLSDDSDPNNFTGNVEICDGQDNDCNGQDDYAFFDGSETDDDGDGQSECEGDCDDKSTYDE